MQQIGGYGKIALKVGSIKNNLSKSLSEVIG